VRFSFTTCSKIATDIVASKKQQRATHTHTHTHTHVAHLDSELFVDVGLPFFTSHPLEWIQWSRTW